MTQDKIRTESVDQLLEVLAKMDDKDAIYALLCDMCTVREITEMSQRLEVAKLLAEKVNYVDTQAATGASTTTISRVSKCLKYGEGGYSAACAILGVGDFEEGE